MSDDFVHLHVHTDYSMLDGAAKIDKLVDETVRQGQKAVAITDHGYLFGAYEFYDAATKAGIKPIVGVEAYVTPGASRHDRTRLRWDTAGRGAATGVRLGLGPPLQPGAGVAVRSCTPGCARAARR